MHKAILEAVSTIIGTTNGEVISMSKIIMRKENCKACGNCVRSCKQNALSFSTEVNEKGYHTVVMDETKCIGCGICYTVCPDYVFTEE